jgi:hypothetical protein
MLNQVHEHITNELQQGARTDTVFVITAIVFNLLVLGINSAVASSARYSYQVRTSIADDLVLGILIVLLILVNAIAIAGLLTGRQTRAKLLTGLLAMYRDNGVDKYYDTTLLTNYNRRYLLFAGAILCLALAAIAVPVIVRLL